MEGYHAGLAGSIVALPGIAVYAHNRSHADYGTAALAHHDGGDGVDVVERRLEVDGEHSVPLLFGHAEHETVLGDACVVHQDVDPAEIGMYLVYDGFGAGEVGGVGFVGLYLYPEGLDPGHSLGNDL